MKHLRRLQIIVVLALFFTVPLTAVTFAQEGDDTNTTNTTDTTEEEAQPGTAPNELSREERAAAREARKQERKERIETNLDAVKQQRTAGRCSGAQQKLAASSQRAETVEANRTGAYERVGDKLSSLSSRLEAAGVDTATLDEHLGTYDTLTTEFFELLTTYQTALSDAAEVDCEQDPEAFLLALEDAKNQVSALKEKSKEIRTHIKDTIVSTLMEIKDELAQSEKNESEESESEELTEPEEGESSVETEQPEDTNGEENLEDDETVVNDEVQE